MSTWSDEKIKNVALEIEVSYGELKEYIEPLTDNLTDEQYELLDSIYQPFYEDYTNLNEFISIIISYDENLRKTINRKARLFNESRIERKKQRELDFLKSLRLNNQISDKITDILHSNQLSYDDLIAIEEEIPYDIEIPLWSHAINNSSRIAMIMHARRRNNN